ncbi:MAG: Asp23/Gls24 family envelope stress response protein [Rubrobacteraceae bacterium]
MSDTRQIQEDSELHSERGTTTIAGTIVSQIAEIATGRIKGIQVGDITTNVGQYEAALDFKMGMEFGRNLKELTSEIRGKISSQVEGMTGLKVKEQNVIVTDIFFPESEEEDQEDDRDNDRDREIEDEREVLLDTEEEDEASDREDGPRDR